MSAGAAPRDRTIRVVLADDDAAFLQSVQTLVEQQPALGVVGVAANGLEVLERVEELDPDAVVIDLHMPLLDGVTAVARLRQDHASLCLIALTGDPEPRLHRAVEEAGADAVMLKGQLLEGLSERIVSVRRGREATARTT